MSPDSLRKAPAALTQRMIDRLEAPASGREEWLMDATVRGLGVRVRPSGQAAYYLRTTDRRSQGTKVRLGDVDNLTLGEARKLAGQKLGELRGSSATDREALKTAREKTFGDLAEEFVELLEARARSAAYIRNVRQHLRLFLLPKLATTPLLDIGPGELERLVYRIAADRPTQANRVRSTLTACFRLATRRNYLVSSPAAGIEKAREEPRRRVLSEEEAPRLLDTLARLGSPAAHALQLILLTTSRPAEVLSARWEQFDLGRGIWTKPAAGTKTKRLHTVALSSEALAVLAEVRLGGGPQGFLFPSTSKKKTKSGHLMGVRSTWAQACKLAGITGATVYDLRRTSATRMLESGADIATVMRAGNWSTPHVLLKVYAQPSLEVQRRASEGLFKRPPQKDPQA